jgi:hypothetical protein
MDQPSRYRERPVALAPDARGRTPATTPLRTRPDTTGTFRHVVAQGERLDNIAYHYYEEPTSWWRICDANPEFLSPLALLGLEPVTTVRFPIRNITDSLPGWATLKAALAGNPSLVGVEDVTIAEEVNYVTVEKTVTVTPQDQRRVKVVEESFRRSLVIRFNNSTTTLDALLEAIKATGLEVDPAVDVGQLGREIVIPPTGAG